MHSRVFGLDILRAFAVLFVLLAHFGARIHIESLQCRNGYPDILHIPFSSSGKFGIFGVEIFFVLSGFLIGQILIKEAQKGLTFNRIWNFYIRRWFRTLPPYYLVLSGLILIDNLRAHQLNLHPWYFVFLQNFFPNHLDFFNVSWSLAIEEWFYLLLPILFYIALPPNKSFSKKQLLTTLLITITFVFLSRTLIVLLWNPSFDTGIRRYIPLRFDSLLVGVVLAHIKLCYHKAYQALTKPAIFWLGLSIFLGLMVSIFSYYIWLDAQLADFVVFKTVGFLLTSVATAACIPFLENNRFINQKMSAQPILFHFFTQVSLYSYSLYLTHATIFYIFSVLFKSSSFIGIIGIQVLAVLFSFAISAIMYHFYEKPCMNLREHFGTKQLLTNTIKIPLDNYSKNTKTTSQHQ